MEVGVVDVLAVGRLRGRRELLVRLPFHGAIDEVGEHARRREPFGKRGLRARAEPDGDGILRCDAAEIAVAPILGRARLACGDLSARRHGLRARAVRENALHDLRGGVGDLRLERLRPRRVRLEHDFPAAVPDLLDGLARARGAAVGDGRVGLRHFLGGHLGRAERERLVRRQLGLDPHAVGGLRHGLRADVLGDAHEARVGRHREGACHSARPVRGAVVVLQLVAVDVRRGRTVHHRLGRDAVFQRPHQRERLERRTRRTVRLRGEVVLVRLEVAPADERLDVAGVGIDYREGHVVLVRHAFALRRRRGLRGLLDARIERGHDSQTAFEDLVLVVLLQQQLAHVACEVRVQVDAVVAALLRRVEVAGQRNRRGLVMLFLGDAPVRKHAVKHHVAARLARLGVLQRVVGRRGLRDADERGRLHEGKVGRVLGEVGLRGGLDAVGAAAVVDGVQVHEQDLVFGVLLFQLHGDVDLAHLALERDLVHLVEQDGVAHELLRDGGRALLAARQVHDHRAHDAPDVEAAVLVEAFVLRGDGAFLHVVADLVPRHGLAVLHVEFGQHGGLVVGKHGGLLRRVVGVDVRVVRQVLEPFVAQGPQAGAAGADHADDDSEERQDGDVWLLGPFAGSVLCRA